jgi:hypothetical protein
MRSLDVVVPHEGGSCRFGLLQVRRPIHGEALLLRGSVVSFDKGVLLRVMRITDLDLDAQTGSKAQQGGRKVTARRAAHPARIAIQGHALGSTVPGQRARQGFSGRFRGEIRAHMRIQEHGGSGVKDVERFDDVLLLAKGIGRHAGHIFLHQSARRS